MCKNRSVKVITDNNLCISCGACTHICPFQNINMQYNDGRGKWDSIVLDTNVCLKCNGEKNCLYVCPSYNTDYTEYGSEENDFFGKIEDIYNCWSKDSQIRYNASSGGFIRTLALELLERKKIDGIVSITHSDELDYFPDIVTDISKLPNSIYHNINYEKAFTHIKNHKGKLVIIGLPCQIMGINKIIRKKKYSYLNEKIYLKIALICGHTFDRVNMEFFSNINNIKMQKITYREKGRYRKTRIFSQKRSKIFDVYNPSSLNEVINNNIMFDKFLTQKHCLYCVDHIGYGADIVVGDAWQKKYNKDKVGTNIVIARTIKGNNVLQQTNNIFFEKGNFLEIEESQNVYSKPFFGLSIAKSFSNDSFVTRHIVSRDNVKFKLTRFTLKDKIKILYFKKLLELRCFKTIKMLYIILEIKLIIKLIIKKLIKKGYR